MSPRLRFEIFKRDDFTCVYCGRRAPSVILHVDHVQARANEGTDHPINLATSCKACNMGKSDIPLHESQLVYEDSLPLVEALKRELPLNLDQLAAYYQTNQITFRKLISQGLPYVLSKSQTLHFNLADVHQWLVTKQPASRQRSNSRLH